MDRDARDSLFGSGSGSGSDAARHGSCRPSVDHTSQRGRQRPRRRRPTSQPGSQARSSAVCSWRVAEACVELLVQLLVGQQSLVVCVVGLLCGRLGLVRHLELGVVVGGVEDGQHALLELGGISAGLDGSAVLGVLAQNLDLAQLADYSQRGGRRSAQIQKSRKKSVAELRFAASVRSESVPPPCMHMDIARGGAGSWPRALAVSDHEAVALKRAQCECALSQQTADGGRREQKWQRSSVPLLQLQ